MIRRHVAGPLVIAAALLLLPSACTGDDDPGPSTTPSTSPAPLQSTAPSIPGTTAPSPASTASTVTAPDDAVRLIEVTFAGGQVAGGVQRRTAQVGERVRLRIQSDVADEVHVHTYDLRAAVAPGQPAVVDLVASIPGRHEVELEKKRKQLLVLEVR